MILEYIQAFLIASMGATLFAAFYILGRVKSSLLSLKPFFHLHTPTRRLGVLNTPLLGTSSVQKSTRLYLLLHDKPPSFEVV